MRIGRSRCSFGEKKQRVVSHSFPTRLKWLHHKHWRRRAIICLPLQPKIHFLRLWLTGSGTGFSSIVWGHSSRGLSAEHPPSSCGCPLVSSLIQSLPRMTWPSHCAGAEWSTGPMSLAADSGSLASCQGYPASYYIASTRQALVYYITMSTICKLLLHYFHCYLRAF